MNNLKIKPIPEWNSYKYLGIDENISNVGLVNKTIVTKEYYTRVKRIWNSELSSVNKVIAHISFVVPVLTITVGILNWTIDEIKEIDIITRKQFTMPKNFHPNGEIVKLYLSRGQGGRETKMIARIFGKRIISIPQYIKKSKCENSILDFVYQQVLQKIIRLSQQLLDLYHIENDNTTSPRVLSKLFVKADLSSQKERYASKVMQSYYERKIMDDPQIDKQLSNA